MLLQLFKDSTNNWVIIRWLNSQKILHNFLILVILKMLTSSYKWHVGCHKRHEKEVHIQWQTGHMNNCICHVAIIHSRFHWNFGIISGNNCRDCSNDNSSENGTWGSLLSKENSTWTDNVLIHVVWKISFVFLVWLKYIQIINNLPRKIRVWNVSPTS